MTLVSRTALGFAVSRAHHADVGGLEPGEPARRLAHARRGGRRDPADPARPTTCSTRFVSRDAATRTSAEATSARSSRRTRSPSGALDELCERRGARARRRPRWTSSTRTRSEWCGRRSPSSRTGAARPRTCSSRRRRRPRRSTPPSTSPATSSGSTSREPRRSTTATSTARSRSRRSACYFVVRCLTEPGPAGLGRGVRSRSASPRPRAASSTRVPPAAVAAGNVETSSRIVDVVFAAFGRAVDVPAQGQGTMNNLDARERPVHVLRDGRRRAGRVPGRRRAARASTSRCRTRSRRRPRRSSSRIRCESSGMELRLGLGRGRAATGRRRRRPRAARARGLPAVACRRAAPPRTAGRAGRRGRQLAAGASSTARSVPAKVDVRPGRGRRRQGRDTRRRRLRTCPKKPLGKPFSDR